MAPARGGLRGASDGHGEIAGIGGGLGLLTEVGQRGRRQRAVAAGTSERRAGGDTGDGQACASGLREAFVQDSKLIMMGKRSNKIN